MKIKKIGVTLLILLSMSCGEDKKNELVPQKVSIEQTVYVTNTGTKYHLEGCKYLSHSKRPMKLSEARKRYKPCSVCNPPL
jgi:hypothetical protein